MRPHDSGKRQRGFTLMEMLLVVAIMLILAGISVPAYTGTILHAREAVLRQDLFTLRSAINQYTDDKEQAPQSLADLVSAGYLKQIPVDPFTRSDGSWQVAQEDMLQSVDQKEQGITDVHSGCDQTSSDGTPYSGW